jgi:two-component system alkaline phosphatase synthesis response regulator PhoP
MPAKVLVVDDEPDILQFIEYNLSKEGFKVFTATDGKQAIAKAIEIVPDLIILDVMMPEIDGIEVAREIREIAELKHTIIAFLTARSEDYTQIAGFEAGGDDYITKPIRPRVLVSRFKALLRRSGRIKSESEPLYFGDLSIDIEKYSVKKSNQPIDLTKKEFKLLILLSSRPGTVFRREQIYSSVWGDDLIVGDRTIDVHIRKLREKIGPDTIKTVKGVGYKFDV